MAPNGYLLFVNWANNKSLLGYDIHNDICLSWLEIDSSTLDRPGLKGLVADRSKCIVAYVLGNESNTHYTLHLIDLITNKKKDIHINHIDEHTIYSLCFSNNSTKLIFTLCSKGKFFGITQLDLESEKLTIIEKTGIFEPIKNHSTIYKEREYICFYSKIKEKHFFLDIDTYEIIPCPWKRIFPFDRTDSFRAKFNREGTVLAFPYTDLFGNQKIYHVDLKTKKRNCVRTIKKPESPFSLLPNDIAWSPDSQWIAYNLDVNGFGIWVTNVKTKESKEVVHLQLPCTSQISWVPYLPEPNIVSGGVLEYEQTNECE